MQVVVIGGGSTYTPELVNGFLTRRNSFPLRELILVDPAPRRLEIVGGLVKRMVDAAGNPFRVVLTTHQREALRGACYAITQLRVGMMAARRADEYLGKRHGLIGQETTGIGGMSKALRSIPVILQIAADMREVAPGALLVNFTNPSGLVTEALARYAPEVPSVGVCNAPFNTKLRLLQLLERRLGAPIEPARAELKTLGLNHLSWYSGLVLDGEDVWDDVLTEYIAQLKAEAHPAWEPRLIESLHMIPNDYVQYYYYTQRKLAAQEPWPPSRAEQVMQIEESLLKQYGDPNLASVPPDLMQRGGAYYSTVATQLLNAHCNNLGEHHIVNARHGGAVRGWDKDWVLEMPCRIDRAGIHPLPTDPLPPVAFGLMAQVKSYELLTVEAAVHGDRNAAYQALLAHPLGPSADRVEAVLEDLLQTHREHLPQFWSRE